MSFGSKRIAPALAIGATALAIVAAPPAMAESTSVHTNPTTSAPVVVSAGWHGGHGGWHGGGWHGGWGRPGWWPWGW